MEDNPPFLTLGQASCLALSLPPTDKNRNKAKKIVTASPFDVTYLRNSNPMTPVAIGKKVKQLNPFLYCSYPETPPPSEDDEEEDNIEVNENIINIDYDEKGKENESVKGEDGGDYVDQNEEQQRDEGSTRNAEQPEIDENRPAASKRKIMDFLKKVFSMVDIESSQYEPMFVTSPMQLTIVIEHFNIGTLNQRQLSRWLTKADFLSYTITYKGTKGRWLYVLKKEYRGIKQNIYWNSL